MQGRGMVFGILLTMLGFAVAEAGQLEGWVQLRGKPPLVEPLRPTADHAVCGAEPRPSGALMVSPSGGVRNAVAFLADEQLEGWRVPTTFVMDQRRCSFLPRILIVPPGATVKVLNSDGILHNFHTLGRLNRSLNLAQSARAKPLQVTFEYREIVEVKCDVHGTGFMRAWIVVAAHPYYAVTDEDGRFLLPNVPAGPHTLEVWHEVLGRERVPVTVGREGTVRVTIELAGEAAR